MCDEDDDTLMDAEAVEWDEMDADGAEEAPVAAGDEDNAVEDAGNEAADDGDEATDDADTPWRSIDCARAAGELSVNALRPPVGLEATAPGAGTPCCAKYESEPADTERLCPRLRDGGAWPLSAAASASRSRASVSDENMRLARLKIPAAAFLREVRCVCGEVNEFDAALAAPDDDAEDEVRVEAAEEDEDELEEADAEPTGGSEPAECDLCSASATAAACEGSAGVDDELDNDD